MNNAELLSFFVHCGMDFFLSYKFGYCNWKMKWQRGLMLKKMFYEAPNSCNLMNNKSLLLSTNEHRWYMY